MKTNKCGHGSLGEWSPCPICEIKRLQAEVERLQGENKELKAHIQRWKVQSLSKYVEHEPDHEGMCFADGMKWPCPTEVAKEFEHSQKLITGDYPKHGDATTPLHD